MVQNYKEFCAALLESGFSMGGGSAKGIYAIVPYTWENQDLLDLPVKWHTGDPETDPWEWRMRVLEERSDIAYAKVFFKTSGFITAEWYPRFLAARRGGDTFEDVYESGVISREAKRIYGVLTDFGAVPLHELKRLGGFGREESGAFDRALIDLQMRMFITMSGRAQKRNALGELYGWSSTVFTTPEAFWAERGLTLPDIDPSEARALIRSRVLALNPAAKERDITRFING